VLGWIYGDGFAAAGEYMLPVLLGASCLLWTAVGGAILRAMDAPAAILPVPAALVACFLAGVAAQGPAVTPLAIAWTWAGAAGVAGMLFLGVHEWVWRNRMRGAAYKS
jgi:hypothetical protein